MALTIGSSIARLRKENGVTQLQLATAIGISAPAVSRWEKGSGYPDIALLPAIARFFGVSIDQLMEYREDITTEDAIALCETARLMRKQGDIEGSLAYLESAYHEYPNSTLLNIELGNALIQSTSAHCEQNEPEQQHIERIRHGLELLQGISDDEIFGDMVRIAEGYGYIYLRDEAGFKKTLEKTPQHGYVVQERWRLLSAYHIHNGAYADGIDELTHTCSDLFTDAIAAYSGLARMILLSGDAARSVEIYKVIAQMQATIGWEHFRADTMQILAIQCSKLGDAEQTRYWLNEYLLALEALPPDCAQDAARTEQLCLYNKLHEHRPADHVRSLNNLTAELDWDALEPREGYISRIDALIDKFSTPQPPLE